MSLSILVLNYMHSTVTKESITSK